MRHGGDLAVARARFPTASDWLDLSTGINPRAWQLARFAGDPFGSLHALPSPARLNGLLEAARRFYSVPDGLAVAAAPGTEVLIRSIPGLVCADAVLLNTTYTSYREAFRAAAIPLRASSSQSNATREAGKSLIVVNPNNPDGRKLAPEDLLGVARSRRGRGVLVVDEAYADAEDECSIVPLLAPTDPVLVLKSFGKFFGLPGLRLGFAIGNPALVARISSRLGDWPVSAPALEIATAAFLDTDWHRETRHWLGNQAQSLDAVLNLSGLTVAGGCRLFRLACHPEPDRLHRALAEKGIWTRTFPERRDVLRVGLPPDQHGLLRLSKALAGL